VSIDWGTVPPPTQFAIGVLMPLNRPVASTREELTGMPGYVANGITGTSDRYILDAIISVHAFAQANTPQEAVAPADAAAWDAYYAFTRLTMGDVVTLPNGNTAEVCGLGPTVEQMPVFQPYRDPYIARYYARYCVPLRFS